MLKKLLLTGFIAIASLYSFAQYNNTDVNNYIDHYKDIAIEEQIRCGIPASITLAQGIFETAAGTSELCTNAQNHFGIKCKNTWTGDTYTYTDDAKDECFRRYKDALTSYKDHSDFLKQNKRYASLFFIPVTDYAAWAIGLKRCGYATNKVYAEKLIETIRKYNLEQYTDIALARANTNKDVLYASAAATPGEYIPTEKAARPDAAGYSKPANVNYYETTTLNGLKGFYARKGDLLLEYAINHKIRYGKLLEWNDLADEPLPADIFIYTEKKNRTGYDATYTVNEGETLLEISQKEGIQLQQLRAYNHLSTGEMPQPGAVLYLQSIAPDKPGITTDNNRSVAGKADTKQYLATANSDYIPTKQPISQAPPAEKIADKNTNSIEQADNEEEADITEAPQEQVNIADEQAVEEDHAYAQQQTKKSVEKTEKNMSELDRLKAQLDKSVYSNGNSNSNNDNANRENHKDELSQATQAKPDKAQSSGKAQTNANPAAALRQHMEKVQDEDKSYTPKTNEDKLIKSKNLHQQTTVKQTTAKKPVHTAAKSAKKTVYHKKSATHKKPATAKKVTPKKKAPVKKAAPKKKK